MVLAQYPKDHPVWRDLTFCSEELHNIVQEGPHVVTAAPPQAPPTRNSAATEMKMPPKELLIPPKAAFTAGSKGAGTSKTEASNPSGKEAATEEQSGVDAKEAAASGATKETSATKTGLLDENGLQELRKMSNWTKEEDDMLIQMHSDVDCTLTFQSVAEKTGRHVNAVKCRWYQCIKPRWEADLNKL